MPTPLCPLVGGYGRDFLDSKLALSVTKRMFICSLILNPSSLSNLHTLP